MMRKLSIHFLPRRLVAASLFGAGPGPRMRRRPAISPWCGAEFGVSNKVVQGAPYSAQAVTEFTQTLANGDHIQRTTTASIARDSQGRTRMDRSLAAVGALSASGRRQTRAIIIHDPVAGMSYALDPASQTARSTPIPAARTANANASARGGTQRRRKRKIWARR